MIHNGSNRDAIGKKSSYLGVRHLQCFLLFCSFTLAYAMRVNLSIAIVAMTDTHNATSAAQQTVYNWSEKTKSYVLSSFFCGYFITQIPGGQLAHNYGGKPLLQLSILFSAIFTILVPLAGQVGDWPLVCVVRFMAGVFQGALFPSAHTILSKWVPVAERGMLGTLCYTGNQFGTIVMLGFSGLLASSTYGWQSIFYVSGGVSLLWCLLWHIYGASTPNDYKKLSTKERNLIDDSLDDTLHSSGDKRSLKIPWLGIFSSVPFLMVIVAHSSNNWVFATLLTQIPAYMKGIHGTEIKSNALLSALPYVVSLLLGLVFSFASKMIQKHECMSLTASRKLFTTISQWVPMITLVVLGYVNAEHTIVAIILLVITVGVGSASFAGWNINHIDLSPNFAGILMGITNASGNLMSFIAPLVVGMVVKNEGAVEQWRIVFFISSGVYFVGSLLYLMFASAKVQPFNNPSQSKRQTEDLHENIKLKEREK